MGCRIDLPRIQAFAAPLEISNTDSPRETCIAHNAPIAHGCNTYVYGAPGYISFERSKLRSLNAKENVTKRSYKMSGSADRHGTIYKNRKLNRKTANGRRFLRQSVCRAVCIVVVYCRRRVDLLSACRQISYLCLE